MFSGLKMQCNYLSKYAYTLYNWHQIINSVWSLLILSNIIHANFAMSLKSLKHTFKGCAIYTLINLTNLTLDS